MHGTVESTRWSGAEAVNLGLRVARGQHRGRIGMEAEYIQGLEERTGLLSGAFVDQVAALYDETNDALVLADDFRRPFLDRGYLTLDELAKIAAWKTQRQKIHVLRNVSETVEAVTRQAFKCPDPWLA